MDGTLRYLGEPGDSKPDYHSILAMHFYPILFKLLTPATNLKSHHHKWLILLGGGGGGRDRDYIRGFAMKDCTCGLL